MISTTLFILFALIVFAVRWAIRRARRLLSASDPFAHPFGELAPLPAGSLIELHSYRHTVRPATRADQGSGGHGNASQGAAAARFYQGSTRRAR